MGNNQPKPDAGDFADRLNQVLNAVRDVPQLDQGRGAWIARRFKVSKPTGTAWVKGHYVPKPERVRDMARMWSVSFDWLYFGLGQMNDSPSQAAGESADSGSQTVRIESVRLASQVIEELLAAAGVALPAAEHTTFLLMVARWFDAGLSRDNVLQFARLSIPVDANGGTDGHTKGSRGNS